MTMRERHHAENRATTGGDDGPATPDLGPARQAGRRHLAAGQAAIARALSENSEAFLRSSRQEGGE